MYLIYNENTNHITSNFINYYFCRSVFILDVQRVKQDTILELENRFKYEESIMDLEENIIQEIKS